MTFTDDADNQESLTSADTDTVAATKPGVPGHLNAFPHDAGALDVYWEAPASDGGSDITGYKVQWKESADSWDTAADVSEATASGTIHTIAGLTDGVEYSVRVLATNGVGDSPPSVEQTGTPRETQAPEMVRPRVDGATLKVLYDEALDEGSAPPTDSFDVRVACTCDDTTWLDEEAKRAVESVSVDGDTVVLTLVSAATSEDVVVVSYTPPSDAATARTRDLAGNAAAGFNSTEVFNDTDETAESEENGEPEETTEGETPLTVSLEATTESHNGTDAFTFELRFSEEVELSYVTLRDDDAFSVTDGEVTGASRLDQPSNLRWQIVVEPDSDADVTIVLPPTTDCGAQGAICTGGGKKLSGRVELTVNGPEQQNQERQNNSAIGAPAISGTPQVGETLTASTSGIADQDGLTGVSYRYQWIADGADISGATGSSHTLTSSEEGQTIKVRVSFTDDANNQETLTSEATVAVTPAPNRDATGAPTISGTPQVNQTLTADTSGITDEDGLTNVSYSYQWIAGGSDIDGATGSSHTLTAGQQGKTIQVQVTFTDDAENEETLTSVATVAVAPAPNRSATGLPAIGGTPQVDQTLTASTSDIADADGLTSVSYRYQWIAGGSDIDGATGSSLTLTASQQGQTIQVRVDFEDDAGNSESLTSVATNAVAAKPVPLTASLSNVPDSHDGSTEFTFTLTFSENVRAGYERIRDDAFTEDGGEVKKAQRMTQGSNQTWTITVEPLGNAAVTITIPVTTDCGATGAICTYDGRMLSHSTSITVAGSQ